MISNLASTRLGMLTPSPNTVLEPLTFSMLANQSDISAHFSRFRVLKISLEADSLDHFSNVPMLEAADLLADAKVQSICWNGTSSGWLGFEKDSALIAEIEARTGIDACSSILAMDELLAKFNAKTIFFVTPYLSKIQQKILNNYRLKGYEIAAEKHLGDPSNFSFASARAGNVIGGGDYSKYRLLPDIISAINNVVQPNVASFLPKVNKKSRMSCSDLIL